MVTEPKKRDFSGRPPEPRKRSVPEPEIPTEPPPLTELDKLRQGLKKGQAVFLTSDEAVGYGYQIETGWLLKVTSGRFTIVTPDKWEIDPATNLYYSPQGEEFTQEQLNELYEQQQQQPALEPALEPQPAPVQPTEPLPVTGIQPELEGMLRRLFPSMFDVTGVVDTESIVGVGLEMADIRAGRSELKGQAALDRLAELSEMVDRAGIGTSFGFTEEEAPMMVLEQLFARAEQDPENLMNEIYQMGRSNDTEALLRLFNPDMTPIQMANFFAAPDTYGNIRQQITTIFNIEDVGSLMSWAEENPEAFYQEIRQVGSSKDTMNLLKTLHPEATPEELAMFFQEPVKGVDNKFLQGVQTTFQYLDGWWKTGLMTLGFRYGNLMDWAEANDEGWYSDAEKILDSAFQRHGWKAIFSSEVNEAWDVYFDERLGKGGFATGLKVVSEFSNPIYFLPASKVASVLARPFRAIPVLGETMQAVAKGVQIAERGLAEATLLPTLGRGIKYGAGKVAQRNLASKYLIAELPQREVLRDWLFKNDYFRKLSQRIPLLGKIAPASTVSARLPKVLGTRAEAGAAVIQETAMRNAILETGQSTKGQALAYLRELGTTKEIYGVRNAMVNPKMVKPKGDYSLALGDVLQAPERYTFTHKNGFEYAKRTQKLMQEMFALAKKEGVNVNELQLQSFEEYVHWVVTGVKDKEGKVIAKYVGRPRGVGAIPPSMKPRRFESMLDGLKDGFIYADDVEVYVSTYVDDMFKAIADHRYGVGMKDITGRLAKELGALPVTPKDRLWAS